MACCFCLKSLPTGKDLPLQEKPVTRKVGDKEEATRATDLGNSDKNLEAFNCLCRLLKVDWRNLEEGDNDDGDNDSHHGEMRERENVTFDTRQPLPLCGKCQLTYQDMYQLYQQIWELEVMMMKRVQMIRETIETTGDGGFKLPCSKLNKFRRMVLESTVNSQSSLDEIPNMPVFLSQEEYLSIKQEVLENEGEEEEDPPEYFEPEVQLEENLEDAEYQVVEEEDRSTSSRRSQRKRSPNKLLIIKTFQKPKTDSPTKTTKKSKVNLSAKNSPAKSTTATTIKRARNGKTKLMQVTESTPKVHIDCYTCCYCGLRFNHTGTLSKHKKRHEPRQLKCPLCPKMFVFDSDVNRHLKLVHKKK